ncbi:sugar transferase [Arthrobacter sp. UYCu511]|uniref:sugar transferase n=1 Tax=Arthrobacter sp. UYCu511 TaxID=3156337 RepID=UPI00339A642E
MRRIGAVDAVVVLWAIIGAHLLRFGLTSAGTNPIAGTSMASYVTVSTLLPCLWWFMLGAWGTRETRVLGAGPEEYKRVFAASLWLFGAVAIVSYAFQLDLARGYVGIAFPTGTLGLIAGRWILRQHLSLERSHGGSASRILVVGGAAAVGHLVQALQRHPHAGYLPVALHIPGHDDQSVTGIPDLPLLGSAQTVESIQQAVAVCGADAVAITTGVRLSPLIMRQLGWALSTSGTDLILAPALTDIAGPRIHTRPVAGLPLIHVTTPRLEGGKRVAKRLFDMSLSGILLLFFAPLMALVAVFIKGDSRGPVFFKQDRVGVLGEPFRMYKFRSMGVDAEARLPELQTDNDGSGLLFKLKSDPRVTRVGAILRRFSIDELPQLINVLNGEMSLVGPRPPLPAEVADYEDHVRRRLLVKPGLTGLWQVSGRSNLSWQDSVRLDLYYVENWSMTGDMVILIRTIRAVLQRDGAY